MSKFRGLSFFVFLFSFFATGSMALACPGGNLKPLMSADGNEVLAEVNMSTNRVRAVSDHVEILSISFSPSTTELLWQICGYEESAGDLNSCDDDQGLGSLKLQEDPRGVLLISLLDHRSFSALNYRVTGFYVARGPESCGEKVKPVAK